MYSIKEHIDTCFLSHGRYLIEMTVGRISAFIIVVILMRLGGDGHEKAMLSMLERVADTAAREQMIEYLDLEYTR